jgi:hypothetical protein
MLGLGISCTYALYFPIIISFRMLHEVQLAEPRKNLK